MLPSATSTPIAGWRWGVIWLMFFATLINYMDRNTVFTTEKYLLAEFVPDNSIDASAPDAKAQLADLRTKAYSQILFAFSISFALFQVVAGFLIDRFSLRWLYLSAMLVWSLAGIASGFVPAGAIGMLIAARVLLGIGEAFNWPCAVACVRRVIPRESRGLANGIFHSGASIGAVALPFLVLLLMNTQTGEGWRFVFVFVGGLGFVWAAAWLYMTRGERAREIDAVPQPDPGFELQGLPTPLAAVFTMRTFWICLVTGVSVNVCWHFYVQWFPRYLTQEVEPSGTGRQWILAGFFVAADVGSMTCGWLTRVLTRSGATVERSRQIVMTGVAVVVFAATAAAVALPMDPWAVKLAAFYVVAAAAIGGFTIFFSLAQDIVPRHTAQILGICGCTSWLAISAVTVVAGDIAGPGKYSGLFLAVSAVPSIAAVVGWLWKRPV